MRTLVWVGPRYWYNVQYRDLIRGEGYSSTDENVFIWLPVCTIHECRRLTYNRKSILADSVSVASAATHSRNRNRVPEYKKITRLPMRRSKIFLINIITHAEKMEMYNMKRRLTRVSAILLHPIRVRCFNYLLWDEPISLTSFVFPLSKLLLFFFKPEYSSLFCTYAILLDWICVCRTVCK